jgi:hypothetical protein
MNSYLDGETKGSFGDIVFDMGLEKHVVLN